MPFDMDKSDSLKGASAPYKNLLYFTEVPCDIKVVQNKDCQYCQSKLLYLDVELNASITSD